MRPGGRKGRTLAGRLESCSTVTWQLILVARSASLQCYGIKRLDSFRSLFSVCDFSPLGERSRLFDDKRAVHQEQRLLRHGGMKSALAAGIRICKVKGA